MVETIVTSTADTPAPILANTATLTRITVDKPATWSQPGTEEQIQKALLLRIKNKFGEAQQSLESVLATESADGDKLSFRSVWIEN